MKRIKRIIVLIGLFATFGLLFTGWQNAIAATTSYTENFEDDTVGGLPSADWYTFTVLRQDGTIKVANNVSGNTLYCSVPAATNNATSFYFQHNNPANFAYVNLSVYVPSGVTLKKLYIYTFDASHTDYVTQITFAGTNEILYNDGSTDTTLTTYSSGWYSISTKYNYTTNKVQIKINNVDHGWFNFYNSASHSQIGGLKIVLFQMDNASARDVHIDNIEFVKYVEGNSPPTADFTYSISGKTVTFSDNSTDSDGTIASWQWDFDGDGIVDSTEQNPSYTYASYGTYNVTLTVTDNDGATASVTKQITLSAPSQFSQVTDVILSVMPILVVLALLSAIIRYFGSSKFLK